MPWKWFLVVFLAGCAPPLVATEVNDYLGEQARYTVDAQAVAEQRNRLGARAVPLCVRYELIAFTALVDARIALYAPDSVRKLSRANDALESAMRKEGVSVNGSRPVHAT